MSIDTLLQLKGSESTNVVSFPLKFSFYRSRAFDSAYEYVRKNTLFNLTTQNFIILVISDYVRLAEHLGVFSNNQINKTLLFRLTRIQMFSISDRRKQPQLVDGSFYTEADDVFFAIDGIRTTPGLPCNTIDNIYRIGKLHNVTNHSLVLANIAVIWVTIFNENLKNKYSPFANMCSEFGSMFPQTSDASLSK